MQLNLSRLTKLMKRDWILYKKPVLYAFAALLIFLCGMVFLGVLENEHEELDIGFWFSGYSFFLIGGGFLLTSIIMWEFKNPAERIEYLAIPASNLEKVLSRWTYTLIIYPLCLTLIFFIVFKITSAIDGAVRWNTPLSDFSEYMTRVYLFGHSVIFVFAVWLNKYVAPKGALVSFIFILIGVLVFSILFRIIFHNLFGGLTMNTQLVVDPTPAFKEKAENLYFPLIKNFLSFIVPLFFYVVTYFKMTEKEV